MNEEKNGPRIAEAWVDVKLIPSWDAVDKLLEKMRKLKKKNDELKNLNRLWKDEAKNLRIELADAAENFAAFKSTARRMEERAKENYNAGLALKDANATLVLQHEHLKAMNRRHVIARQETRRAFNDLLEGRRTFSSVDELEHQITTMILREESIKGENNE